MLIGMPREIKDNEFRVGLTPASVAERTPIGNIANNTIHQIVR